MCVSKTSEPASPLLRSSCICEISNGTRITVTKTLATVLGCVTDRSAIEALAKAGEMQLDADCHEISYCRGPLNSNLIGKFDN